MPQGRINRPILPQGLPLEARTNQPMNKKTSGNISGLLQQGIPTSENTPDLPSQSLRPGCDPSNPLTPAQLNRLAKNTLESHFGQVWISGEISSFTRHAASGHCYFTLKDKHASISCAWFRRQIRPGQNIRNGDSVLIFGQISLYEARGAFQVIVQRVESGGQGDLYQQFLALKKRLEELGLFDRRFKKDVPAHPRRIAIVTSKSGAAVQDVLKTIARRNPLLEVQIFHASVQGDGASETLISALEQADAGGFDAILLTRGGGSLEDLWAFNDEGLAHTIFTLKTPLVSAVGHERDFTIADEVADARAATPTAGAELLSPNLHVTRLRLQHAQRQLSHLAERQLQQSAQTLDNTENRLYRGHPLRHLARQSQNIGRYQHILQHRVRQQVAGLSTRLNTAQRHLHLAHPAHRLAHTRQRLEKSTGRLIEAILSQTQLRKGNTQTLLQRLWRQLPNLAVSQQNLAHLQARLTQSAPAQLERKHARLQSAIDLMERLSPLKVLQRGYSITLKAQSGEVITQASQVKPGDILQTQLGQGLILSRTIDIEPAISQPLTDAEQ